MISGNAAKATTVPKFDVIPRPFFLIRPGEHPHIGRNTRISSQIATIDQTISIAVATASRGKSAIRSTTFHARPFFARPSTPFMVFETSPHGVWSNLSASTTQAKVKRKPTEIISSRRSRRLLCASLSLPLPPPLFTDNVFALFLSYSFPIARGSYGGDRAVIVGLRGVREVSKVSILPRVIVSELRCVASLPAAADSRTTGRGILIK